MVKNEETQGINDIPVIEEKIQNENGPVQSSETDMCTCRN